MIIFALTKEAFFGNVYNETEYVIQLVSTSLLNYNSKRGNEMISKEL